ncbi:MAG TPA: NAD(P)H-dependent glycerol-3-phosphate dehydrogenase [Acidobacteriaceae bacterium]|nr:NAD(P)H-dependent glycerol-3-phosphate dehydrogenase [Acidobacteriaceae bacterium]
MSRIAVIGAGSWGTALALALERHGGHSIRLWSHTQHVADSIERERENRAYLPGFRIPDSITVTTGLDAAVGDAEILVLVVPSEHLRSVCQSLAPSISSNHVIVNATKGIEDASCLRMSQVIADVFAQHRRQIPHAVLGGPSFAQEVASGSPTAITVAAQDARFAVRIQEEFSGPTLRLYTNDDVIGVEVGGALKNVIAIAAGATHGLGLGHNTVAALITRGIAEMTRLAIACGGQPETLAGLAGLGDLVLTCTGTLSRNRYVGVELGRGRGLRQILDGMHGKVAEGVRTTHAALGLARSLHVEMPITEQVACLLEERISAERAVRELMARPGRDE